MIWYCDPINGSMKTGDGSKGSPWGSLESVVKARLVNGFNPSKGKIHAGDTMRLMSGNHGKVILQAHCELSQRGGENPHAVFSKRSSL